MNGAGTRAGRSHDLKGTLLNQEYRVLLSGRKLPLLPSHVSSILPKQKHKHQSAALLTTSQAAPCEGQSVKTFIPVFVEELRLKPHEREENLQIGPPGG